MGSRERKRTERRRRKERTVERYADRTQAKNQEAREALKPLPQGDRPPVVTAGAIVSGLLCVSILVAYAAGAEVDGEKANVVQVIVPALLTGVMAWGMWRTRYWAVLGFQVVLAFLILATALGLVAADSAVQVIGNLALLAIAGTLFFFMVKALARIQMPERPGKRD